MAQADLSTTDPLKTPRRLRWRRLLHYRLRTLLVLLTLVAAWLAWWTHHVRQQRRAVAAITELGGAVVYDFDHQNLARPPR